MGDGTEEQNLARMQSREVQRVIIDRAWASLANRSSFKGAVFSRVARVRHSYSIIALSSILRALFLFETFFGPLSGLI
jgi:hypothetical protein